MCNNLHNNKCSIVFSKKDNHTKPGVHIEPAAIMPFAPNQNNFLVTHIQEYLQHTAQLKEAWLWTAVHFHKSHAPVARASFSPWVKERELNYTNLQCNVLTLEFLHYSAIDYTYGYLQYSSMFAMCYASGIRVKQSLHAAWVYVQPCLYRARTRTQFFVPEWLSDCIEELSK